LFGVLKKVRSNPAPRGNFRRYLRYAIGEIVLVVIGILIAIQIDNWNDARADREKEHEYLVALQSDLREDMRNIETAVSGNEVLLAGMDDLLVLLADPESGEAYRRSVFLASLVYTYWHLRVEFSELTLTQLKYSGDLQLIRDRGVRQALLGYEQGVEFCRHQYGELTAYFHVFEATQKQLFDYTLAKSAFAYIEEDYMRILEPLARFEPLVPQGEYFLSDDAQLLAVYYGDLLFYRTAMYNVVELLNAQQHMAQALLQLINLEYEIED